MAYSKLLAKIIANTNYTQEEVAQKCCELGVKVRREKINALVNNRESPPDEELSRAIAKVCNVDERKLVLEGYLDTAPKEIQDVIKNIQYMIYLSAINYAAKISVEDIFTEEEILEYNIDKNINILETFKTLVQDEPLSETLIQLLDDQEENIDIIKNGFQYVINDSKMSIELKNPIGFTVNDNSMKPLIEMNDKVTIQIKKVYKNSDIVIYTEKKDKNKVTKIRSLTKVNNTIIMCALNKEYKEEIYDKDDILIVGCVNNIIKKI